MAWKLSDSLGHPKKYLLNDSGLHGLAGGPESGIRRDFVRLFGSKRYLRPNKYLEPPEPLACDLERLTCSWWLLMALPDNAFK